jgi:hypothetical protein
MKLATIGVVCIVLGAALSPGPLGFIGYFSTLVGGGILTIAVTRAREDEGTTRLNSAVGLLLEVPAGFAVAAFALISIGLAEEHRLGIHRSAATTEAMAAIAWLLLPSIITLGIYLRTGWPGGRLARWWLSSFIVQPAAVLCFMIL